MKNIIDKKDIYKEVFVILSHFNNELLNKLPRPLFNELVDLAADSNFEVDIDPTKKLEEQNISEESKNLISLIYYKFVADDDEKKELIKIWQENDKKD